LSKYDVVIIGGGPGGYVAAIRAAQLGLKTAVVEKERVGGLCLNWGCIPSKALLSGAELAHLMRRSQEFGITHDNLRLDLARAVDRSREVVEQMVKGVEFLLDKNKVAVVSGQGRLVSKNEVAVEPEGETLEAEHIILATGGVARSLPGVEVDGCTVLTSREALEMRELPASVAIIGGGPIGVEFAYLYNSYGAKVTIIEMLDHLLPLEDEDVSRQLERSFRQQGIGYLTKARVEDIRRTRGKARVAVSVDGREQQIEADKVLIGIGLAASSEGLGLEELGVEMERGFVKVDGAMRTSVSGIYAVGDVTGKLMLAHVAAAQGVVAVEGIAGLKPPELDYDKMPRCTYCQPQVASCGLTETQARQQGRTVRVGRFPFRANGKAMAAGESDGFVKVVIDADDGEVIGCHVIGPEATELIAEAALSMSAEITAADLIWTVHAHPTLSEAVKEAALVALGRGVHFWSGTPKEG
jgi:dihydrolipoamide dehydrogenase